MKKSIIVEKATNISILAFEKFIKNINLEPSMYDHIYNIKVSYNKMPDDKIGEYNAVTNSININSNWLDELELDNKSILNVANVILHEMIHANRTIIINNGLSLSHVSDKLNNEINLYEIDTYKLQNLFEKDIVIKRISIDNNECIIYNKKQKRINILEEDESGTLQLKKSIADIKHQEYEMPAVVCDYYHEYDNKVVKEKCKTLDEYLKKFLKEVEEINEMIKRQDSLEETMTEVIALIILINRKKDYFNLEECCNKLKENVVSVDEKIILSFLEKMDTEFIRWFFTAVYEEHYVNEYKNILKEEYDRFLTEFDYILDTVKNNEKVDRNKLDDIKKIIKNIKR